MSYLFHILRPEVPMPHPEVDVQAVLDHAKSMARAPEAAGPQMVGAVNPRLILHQIDTLGPGFVAVLNGVLPPDAARYAELVLKLVHVVDQNLPAVAAPSGP
jgi:hypothetical protein